MNVARTLGEKVLNTDFESLVSGSTRVLRQQRVRVGDDERIPLSTQHRPGKHKPNQLPRNSTRATVSDPRYASGSPSGEAIRRR